VNIKALPTGYEKEQGYQKNYPVHPKQTSAKPFLNGIGL
jgi:hypothetical protein